MNTINILMTRKSIEYECEQQIKFYIYQYIVIIIVVVVVVVVVVVAAAAVIQAFIYLRAYTRGQMPLIKLVRAKTENMNISN
jgi:hypothetical protein